MKPSFAGVEMPMLNQSQMQEQVKTLFGADVSDEFITQATSLYEASLNTNLQAISEQMSYLFEEKLSEHVVDIAEQLESNVSDYLGYVVEEWVKENQLAVDNGLRTEICHKLDPNNARWRVWYHQYLRPHRPRKCAHGRACKAL